MKLNASELAMKYLAYRDRTSSEIQKYLISKEISQEDIDTCLQYLKDYRYVDDEDYCRRYFLYSIEKGRGPLRITRDLREKGIPDELIDMGIEEHFGFGNEAVLAMSFVEKLLTKEVHRLPLGEKEIAKIGRRLASSGYHSHAIYEVLDKLVTFHTKSD